MKKKMTTVIRKFEAALFALAMTVVSLSPETGFLAYAEETVSVTATGNFFAKNDDESYTLTVSLSRDGNTKTGLIAESYSEGAFLERAFATKEGSGQVAFTFENPAKAFRVIAVDQDTLAPVCDVKNLSMVPDTNDITFRESTEIIPSAGAEHTASVLRAVVKDLILAGDTLDDLNDLTVDTVSVTYEKPVTTQTEGDDDTTTQTVMESVTEEMTCYDAIAYSEDAREEAANRLTAMRTAYGRLKTAAAVLYHLAEEEGADAGTIRHFALQAGDVAVAAENAAVQIETGFAFKKEYEDEDATGLLNAIADIGEVASKIRILGGAHVLTDGCFGVYPGGADLALVADELSSAVILAPDNGIVTEGSVVRADKEPDEDSIRTDRVVILADSFTGVLDTPSENGGTFFTGFWDLSSLAGQPGEASENLTVYSYASLQEYWRDAVPPLTEYAATALKIDTVGTYTTWNAVLNAFLSTTDNSDETISGIAGDALSTLQDEFETEAAEDYNRMMGYTTQWIGCPDPNSSEEARRSFYRSWDATRCTVDSNGNYIGLYENYTYGVKTFERYYATPGKGYTGLLYEKHWAMDDRAAEEASQSDDYDPADMTVLLHAEAEFGSSFTLPSTGAGPDGAVPAYGSDSGEGSNDSDEMSYAGEALGGPPKVPFMHILVYYQEDESGKAYTDDSQLIYKDALCQWNQETYEARKRQYSDEFENSETAFDLQYGPDCWEAIRQLIYNRDGDIIREFRYVGNMATANGTEEMLWDRQWVAFTNGNGGKERNLHVDQYIPWDPSQKGYLFSELNYIGMYYRKTYYVPFPNDTIWEKIPQRARRYVLGHLHGEDGKYNYQEYVLGTWEVDEENPDNMKSIFHPWAPSQYTYTDTNLIGEDQFMCSTDNRIGWRHIIGGVDHDIQIKYEDLAPGINRLDMFRD